MLHISACPFPCKTYASPQKGELCFSIHTHTSRAQLSLDQSRPVRAGTTAPSSLQTVPACSGRSASTGLYSSLRGVNYGMVKTQLPQPGCGQELEEENLAVRNQQHRGGISQGQLHSCVFAVTRGAPISSQLSKEEMITSWMLLVFTLPAGLFSEQHAKIVGKWEEMALQVLKAEFAVWQRLGRGRFLGAEQYKLR